MTDNNPIKKEESGFQRTVLVKWISRSGDSLFLFPLFFLLLITVPEKLKICVGLVLAGMTLSGIFVWALKQIFKKERPLGEEGQIYRKFDPYSFPSGHVARGFVIATIAVGCNWHFSALVLLWAIAILMSRLILKLHFYIDVIAGLIIGAGIGLLIIWLQTILKVR